MEKGHIEFESYADVELIALKISAEKMYHALKVLLESEKLKSLLEVNDQKAYEQANEAVKDYEDNLFHL
jgi:hypothetical protein